jgi:hypothetical protein
LTRRPDTRFVAGWIARLAAAGLAGVAWAAAGGMSARAQILGSQTPGTPGALDGELRIRPAPPPPPRAEPALRPPDAESAGPPASRRSGIRRTPNTALRRETGSGQNRPGGFAGASPAGASGIVRPAAPGNAPGDLTGTRFETIRPDIAPPPARPSVTAVVAPGLPPAAPPPLRRPRPEDDPYAPLGIRAGSLILRPAIEIDGGYDTNAQRTSRNRRGSAFWRTEGEFNATSDWSRHQFDLGLRGAYTAFTGVSNANRPEGEARLGLRLDASRDQTIETTLSARIDTERPGSANLPGGVSERVPYYNLGASLGGTQRFGRTSLALRTTAERALYEDARAGGVTISQEARNVTTYGARARLGHEITPGFTPFAEAGIDTRRHDLRLDQSGYERDSRGLTLRTGSSFEIERSLTGEASLGYTFRAYEDARLRALRAPVLDAALTWSISPLTTLNLRAQSEIAETTIAGSSGALTYRGTATLTHAFLRNFTATATLGIARADYDRVNREETTLTAGLRLEYRFSRLLAARASYAFERYSVNTPGENYQAHTMLLGLRLTP